MTGNRLIAPSHLQTRATMEGEGAVRGDGEGVGGARGWGQDVLVSTNALSPPPVISVASKFIVDAQHGSDRHKQLQAALLKPHLIIYISSVYK